MFFNEDLIQFVWQNQLFDFRALKTLSGKTVTVIHPGVLNRNSGPDFEHAKVKIDNTLFVGSVEIHLIGNDWYNHSHENDSAYNNVVLHVCYQKGKDVMRQDATEIPCVELAHLVSQPTLAKYKNLMVGNEVIPCQDLIHSTTTLDKINWIERMSIERLEERSSQIDDLLKSTNNNWNETIYSLVLRSCGSPINTVAFEEIAEKLPFKYISKHSDNLFQIEALLFGTAGLLDEVDNYSNALLAEYLFLKEKYGLGAISTQIKFGKMRPMALPTVKLAQFSSLLHKNINLLQALINDCNLKTVYSFFEMETSEYWNTHYVFGKETKQKLKKFSSTGIQHILINAIIPCLFHYEKQKESDIDALELLQELTSEKNHITNKMTALGFENKNACESQGILHLYKTYCLNKRCLNCNIGRTLLLKK